MEIKPISCVIVLMLILLFLLGNITEHSTPSSTKIPIHTPAQTNITTPASTGSIIINKDKTISINGKKKFPVFMYGICHPSFKRSFPCNPSKNTEFLFNAEVARTDYPMEEYEIIDNKPKHEANKVYWTVDASNANTILSAEDMNSSYFFGYYQIDEPEDSMIFTLQDTYNSVKARDQDHPIILNHWKNLWLWRNFGDIITWDTYTIKDTDPSHKRQDSIYYWELNTENTVFKGHPINDFNKPVYAVLQANGQVVSCGKYPCSVPTTAEARALTYSALSLGVQGIGYWGYILSNKSVNSGLSTNPPLHDYYKQLARELNSLNDVLVLPTYANSWYGHQDWINVSLDPNPSKRIGGQSVKRFSYLLKYDGTTDKWYLFVVNKDSTSIANVQITLKGLTGTMTARTLGLETTGSQRANRTLSVNNGVFTDSFDAYAAHVYEIYSVRNIPSEIMNILHMNIT